MSKALIIDYEKCIGCMTCEMVCSVKHEGVINPFQSRINIVKWEMDEEGFLWSVPNVSQPPVRQYAR